MLSLWTSALICCVIFASQASAGNYIITLDCGNETECSKILTAIESNLSEQLATSTNETNNVTILDLNECDRINSVCSKDATCTNMFRSYKCKCNAGFFDDDLLRPGINCSDVNECSNSSLNNCSLDARCQNTPGGFNCTCNTGFADLTFSNGTNCTDINECSDPLLHKCSRNASCVNLPGNYSCACAVGFQDNDPTTPGTNCSDVNECNDTNPCPSNSNCSNTQGSYSCTCNPGYTIVAGAADKVACFDLDECSNSSLNNCTTSQMCVNTEGTYFCNDVTTTQTKATTAVTTNPPAVTTGTTAVTTASTAVTTARVAVTTPSEPATNASIAATTAQQTTAVSTTAETTTSPITSPSVTSEIATTSDAITTPPSTTPPSTTSSSTTSSSTSSPSTTSPSTTSPSTTSPSTTSPSTTSPGTTATTQISTTSVQPSTNAATTSTTQSPNLPPSITENITAENIENGSKLYSLEAVSYINTMKENFTSGEAMAIVANLEMLVVPGGGIPVNENVATSVLEVIDAFGASSGDFSSDVTSSLTSLTDTLLSNMQLIGGSFELNLPTVSVGAKDLTGTETKPIAFSLGSGFENSTNSNASIELPTDILSNADKQQRISFSGFTNARLFPSPGVTTITSPDFMFGGTTGSVVNSAVMGSTVANTTVRNRENPIRIALPAIVSSIPTVERSNGTRVLRSVFNPRCAFHDVTMNGGLGGWSRQGCVTVATSSVEGGVTCECNHLTSFAVLMSVEESSHDDVLHIMTFVGCALSITGLVITIVTYTLFRQFRTHKSKRILVHFCLSLFGVSITYLLGIATHLPSNQEQCIAAGFFMHFFTTSTFAWMFIEVFDMYLMFVKVMNVGRHHYVRKACLFGWGFPALLASCTLGAHFALVGNYPGDEEMRMYPTYRSTVACWLNQRALLWALILPMAILMFVNIVLFSFVLYHVTCKRANTMQQSGNNNMRRNSLKEVKASHHVINATAIILLTGPTWIIGFLINIDPVEDGVLRRILSYIFVIFNAFQGLWVFLIFTVRPKSVRQRWKSLLCEKGGLQSVSRASASWGKQSSRNTGSVSTRSHHNLKQNVSFDQRRISALSSNTGVTLVRHSVDHGQGAGKSPRPQPASQRSYDKSATLPSSDKSPVVSYRYSRETSKVDHDVTNDEVTNSNVIMDDVNKPDVTTDDVTGPEVVTEDVYAPVKKKNKVSPEDKELSRSDSDVTRTNIDLETGSDVGLVQSEESGDFEAARN